MTPGERGEILAGPRVVLEALRAGRRAVRRIQVARQEQARLEPLLALARSRRVPVEFGPRLALDRRAGGTSHQGVVAEVGPYPYVAAEELLGPTGATFLLVLDGIQDPQNLGAILRTAETAGVQGAVILRDRAAGVTPAAVRASAGATEHLRVARVGNLAGFLARLKDGGLWVVGADANGGQELFGADLRGPLALVIGAEGTGLRALTRSRCDLVVRIPQAGQVASLNASAAAAVCLFEAVRQRKDSVKSVTFG